MQFKSIAIVCCATLCALPALSQIKSATKGISDQQFVVFAAQTDMVEANLGQWGTTVAASQAVKDYAAMLAADHTQDYKALSKIAQQENLQLPQAIDPDHNKAMIGPFHKLKNAAFDHRYIADMVAGHRKAIAVYEKEVKTASSPALKKYAQEALPVLHKHLDGARKLETEKVK